MKDVEYQSSMKSDSKKSNAINKDGEHPDPIVNHDTLCEDYRRAITKIINGTTDESLLRKIYEYVERQQLK